VSLSLKYQPGSAPRCRDNVPLELDRANGFKHFVEVVHTLVVVVDHVAATEGENGDLGKEEWLLGRAGCLRLDVGNVNVEMLELGSLLGGGAEHSIVVVEVVLPLGDGCDFNVLGKGRGARRRGGREHQRGCERDDHGWIGLVGWLGGRNSSRGYRSGTVTRWPSWGDWRASKSEEV
jgi:hypothetical protein